MNEFCVINPVVSVRNHLPPLLLSHTIIICIYRSFGQVCLLFVPKSSRKWLLLILTRLLVISNAFLISQFWYNLYSSVLTLFVLPLSIVPAVRQHSLPCLFLNYFTLPYLTSPYLTLPNLTSPYLTSPRLTSHNLTLPHLTSHYLTLPYLILPYNTLPWVEGTCGRLIASHPVLLYCFCFLQYQKAKLAHFMFVY